MQIRSILPQAEIFLRDDVKIPIVDIKETNSNKTHFALKDYSSVMDIDGTFSNVKVIISFDTSLIKQIIHNFMGVSEIKEDDREALYLDGSGEVMNIIFGLASPEYIKDGESIQMHPPVRLDSIEDIEFPKNCSVLQERITTEFGDMSIDMIESPNDYHALKKKVLVVDDSLMARSNMTSLLKNLGHEVITAQNGNEAIELYKENRPDLVTMDIIMPDMDGVTSLHNIIKFDCDAKIIMVTSQGQEVASLKAFKKGALDYILKPVTEEKLENAMNKIFFKNER